MAFTVLQAVNKLLRTIHEAPVAAVDTGASSVAGLAEVHLGEANAKIQARGWAVNTEYDQELEGADITNVAMVITDGAWDVSAMTLTKTAAFAAYTWAHGDQLYVSDGTGVTVGWYVIASKTSDNVIVMAESIADNDAVDIDTTLIGWEDAIAVGSDILTIDATDGNDTVVRNGMLYDSVNDTFSYADGVTVKQVRQLDFLDLPLTLQDYVIALAAIGFQRRMTQGKDEDTFLRQEYLDARRDALREESETDDVNILDDAHGQSILGNSRSRATLRR